jgi:hypothetical protein
MMSLLAVLLVAIGVLPWCGPATLGVRIIATVALVAGVVLALLAWGMLHSTVIDTRREREAQLDSTLIETAGRAGAGCGCGHEHDPDELHFTDADPAGDALEGRIAAAREPCSADAADCTHTCQDCTLAALRG